MSGLVLSHSSYLTYFPNVFFQYSSVSSLSGSVFMLLTCHWEYSLDGLLENILLWIDRLTDSCTCKHYYDIIISFSVQVCNYRFVHIA